MGLIARLLTISAIEIFENCNHDFISDPNSHPKGEFFSST